MPLFLVESALPAGQTRTAVGDAINRVDAAARQQGAELLEVQVAADLTRLFVVVEAAGEDAARQAFAPSGYAVSLLKQVRLVGQDLETVKQQRRNVNYVVEWNFPAGLTMEKYLERKKANSPKYELVPQVKFHRTYVCEDMTKCLCLYDAPDAADVLLAREAVQAPVDALTPIQAPDKE